MEPSKTLTRLAGILEMRKQALSRPYNLLLTSTLSLTPTILQNVCHSDNWSIFRQHMYDLGQRDRLNALRPLLQTSQHSDGYRALARLITKGYFSTILTTNIDSALENALEDALVEEGLRPRSFQMLVLDRDTDEHVVQALDDHTDGTCIVKLHGSLQEGIIPAPFPDFFELRRDILESVKRYLNQDMIIVGSIEHEDDINRALTRDIRYGRSSVYYAHPCALALDDNVVKLIKARGNAPEAYVIAGQYGAFNLFFTTLEALLLNKTATSPEQRKILSLHEEQSGTRDDVISNNISAYKQTMSIHPSEVRVTDLARSLELRKNTSRGTVLLPSIKKDDLSIPISPALESEQRQKVCIFYSQMDKKYLLQLMKHFRHFERKGLLDVWADINISAGRNWIEEIQETMKVLKVAVLLVSADFLASSFIAENILPPLLKAADTHGAAIVPVLLGHCVFEDTALAQFRAFNDPAKPLNTKKSSDRSKDWADLVRYVITLV
jgi:hypothetical protein